MLNAHHKPRIIAAQPKRTVRAPAPSVEEQLYTMYARGELDEDAFRALKALAEKGQLQPVDLAVHRLEALRRRATRGRESDTERSIRQIRARLVRLEKARSESTQVLDTLQKKMAALAEEAEKREAAAREAVAHDEERARRYLEEKQELLATRARLEEQAAALQEDLQRIDELRLTLEARIAELEALRTREELQKLEP